MKYFYSALLAIMFTFNANTQTNFNLELQAYPTGFIPGIRIETQLNQKTKAHLRLGMNIFNHRDLGVQDEESGHGFGFTLGAARTLKNPKFELGIRNDVWFNRVNWRDNNQLPVELSLIHI